MTTPEQFQSILLRLLQSLGDDKRSVDVWQKEPPLKGRINWTFDCTVAHLMKVVGRNGTRFRALRLIVDTVGRNQGEHWWLDQAENPSGERPLWRQDAEIPEHHDTTADFELLCDLLLALNINATTHVGGTINTGFRFTIIPAQIQDNCALLDAQEALFSASQKETQPLNLISCLGALWRAIGAVQGVRYGVNIGGD